MDELVSDMAEAVVAMLLSQATTEANECDDECFCQWRKNISASVAAADGRARTVENGCRALYN